MPSRLPFTDAPTGWPDAIQVSQTWNYDDTDPDTNIEITKTGTADFTYSRIHLTDVIEGDKLLFCDLGFLVANMPAKSFLPVQCAFGKMPGWFVFFGAQPAMKNAFVFTTTYPTDSSGNTPTPKVEHADANCSISMGTCLTAPGRHVLNPMDFSGQNALQSDASNRIISLNDGVQGDVYHDSSSYSVEQVQAPIAATDSAPAVPPVYRVTIPSTVAVIATNGFTINLNGSLQRTYYFVGPWPVIGALASLLSSYGRTYPRSPWVCDVQMLNPGDTLAAGTISYFEPEAVDANDFDPDTTSFGNFVQFTDGSQQAIPDPFSLSGQSFSSGGDEDDPDGGDSLQETISL